MGEVIQKVGIAKSKEYRIWQAAKNRCLNKSNQAYPDYGGRGITMSKEWMNSFAQFVNDLGERPSPKHQLERIDNNKGYNKSNCRWALPSEQAYNKRSTIRYNGVCLAEYCKKNHLNYKAILQRIACGWPIEKAVNTPIRTRNLK